MADDKNTNQKYHSDNFDSEAKKIDEKESIAQNQESEFKSALNNENKAPQVNSGEQETPTSKMEELGSKASNKIKKKTTNTVKNKANKAAAKVGGKLKKQTAKIAGQLAKKIAASVLTTGLPWLLAGLGALGGVALISYFAGLVVDNEFSRTQDANYAHTNMADLNTVMTTRMGSKGNVFFNSETGRYELAKGKQPTQANKLQYVYYAVMSNQSKWFVTYQRDKSVDYKPESELKEEMNKEIEAINKDSSLSDTEKAEKIQKAVDNSHPKYYKPVEIKGDKKQYTIDGKMFNLNELDKVGLKGNNPGETVTLDNVLNEKSSKYIEKLALNVNLLYLLDSTMNGSQLGTGKNQMFFGEQFVKPVYHDENYNFKPLTEYRMKTDNELAKTAAKAHGDDNDSQVEKEFQEKYSDWTDKLNAQNLARGGGQTFDKEESTGTSSEGINNPVLKKAFEWGSSQLNKGITYSMGARTGPTSYDCSGFVLTALNKAGFEVPVFNTVAMLQATEWMDGPDGGIPGEGKLEFGNKKYFKQVDLKTAKKGTIVVVGGINGGGAAGHTFFLAEDFHGGDTKVLECSGGANGINIEGTYKYASMGELHPVAIEPKGDASDSNSDSGKDKDDSSSSKGHQESGDYSKYVETSLRNQVSTGKLVAQSRKFNTSYKPEIKSGLYKEEDINYNVWRDGDFFVNSDALNSNINWIDYSQASGNSTFNTSGPIKEKSGAAEKSQDTDILHSYSSDRAELTKWSLEHKYNPAFVASLVDVISNNSNKDFFGSQYNFLNDTDILEEKDDDGNNSKSTNSSETNKEIDKSGKNAKDYGDYGADNYNNEFKINSISQGLDALFSEIEKDNDNKEWNQDIAKRVKLSKTQYERVNSEYSKAGGLTSEITIPEKASSDILKDKFYTYDGSGYDDKKALGNIQIDGKTNEEYVGNSKLYYVKKEKVSQGDAAITPENGESALVKDKDGNPEMTTGIWDYGFGSIFKIARNEYTAYQIGMDEHGKYKITGDSGFLMNLGQQITDGSYNSAKDTEYTIIGVTTPFGTVNLADDFVKDSSEFNKIVNKLNNNEDLSAADVELLEKHKEGTSIKVQDQTKTAEDGNAFYSDKPVVSSKPELVDSQGGQYIMDYLENYEIYVPSITESKLDPLKRWKAMNDINASSQEGMNKIQDIFNKLIGDDSDKNKDNTSSSENTGDSGFDKETMKKIYDGLIDRGMGTYGAIGIMVNMAHESGFRPDAINASSGAMGLSQWLGGRADGLKQYAASKGKPWQDIDVQLDYLVSGEPGVIHDVVVKVAQNKDQYQATRDFYIAWEMHGGGISYVGMSEEGILADPITSGNGGNRIKKENVDKMYNEIVGKDGKVIEPDMTKLGGTTESGSNSSSTNSDGTTSANWGDGTSFFGKVTGFLHDIKGTVLSIFGNDKNWDPTMFSTDPIKPIPTLQAKSSELIYDKDGNIMNDKLIVNGIDAYKWRKYSKHLSTDNARMVLRQFVASMETRDARPVYYDEVYDNFNSYDLDRIVEENYKYNLQKLFEKDDSEIKNTGKEQTQVASPIKGQDIANSKAKGTAGYIKDGNNVDVHIGLTFTGDNKEVVALKAGKVVFSGSDGKFGNTVIIRSTNNTEQIAYTNLGSVSSPKVGKTVTAGDTIGKTSSKGVTVVGINKNSDAGNGLSKLKPPTTPSGFGSDSSDVYDLVNYFGITGENQNRLIKDTNNYDVDKFKDKKPSSSDIKEAKEVNLKDYVTESVTSSGNAELNVPSGYEASKPSPQLANYDASTYPYGQCTWFVYNRALELGVKYGKYMGNGGNWQLAAGYTVTQTPTLHSAVSFKPGEAGSDPLYGHVAFVEQVKSDGSILVSESNVKGAGVVSYRTFSKSEASTFHYVIGK